MPGIYSFSCGQAYAAHSNTIAREDGETAARPEPVTYLSYLHNTKNQTAEPVSKGRRPITMAEVFAGVKVDDCFELAVIAIAFMTFAAIGLGVWGLISWLKPKPQQPAVQQVLPPPVVYTSAPVYYPAPPQGSVFSAPSVGYGVTMTEPGYVAVSRLKTTVCR